MIFINAFMHFTELKISSICLTLHAEEIPSLHSIVNVNKCLETHKILINCHYLTVTCQCQHFNVNRRDKQMSEDDLL